MATLRTFILNQSSLPTGNIVRDHIQNPSSGGGVSGGGADYTEFFKQKLKKPKLTLRQILINEEKKKQIRIKLNI